MSTTNDYLNYLKEQTKDIHEVSFRPMMGEYLVYFNGKLVGDVCDNRLLVKPVKAALNLLPDAEMQPPYAGAKPMILVEDTDNTELLYTLFTAMYEELPEPKKKREKK